MKIGLYNLEHGKVINTALMQVSMYHKLQCDHVERYNPLFHSTYDKVYAFSIFDFTPKNYVTSDMICGGTGFDIKSRLPKEIEACDYDYDYYPLCDTSFVWFSRGCIRNCDFCIVRDKEGCIQPVQPKALNPKGKFITIKDNNFFANPKWHESIKQLVEWNQPVNFDSGIDVRIFNDEQGEALKQLRLKGYFNIAWDNPKQDLVPKIEHLKQYIKAWRIICYVLIGYNSNEKEDLYRVEALRNIGVMPFVMPYDKSDPYQKSFARWVNHKAIFKSVKWENYNYKLDKLMSERQYENGL